MIYILAGCVISIYLMTRMIWVFRLLGIILLAAVGYVGFALYGVLISGLVIGLPLGVASSINGGKPKAPRPNPTATPMNHPEPDNDLSGNVSQRNQWK
ncbi:hypothetical protein [Rahnella sp. ChDrAdgB13]|uniref:hypothetical protein n=1 Tax=Rahnella sp. ChDrAdgB13 TaxID=1850581 RepID=UPI001AD875B3|nr:hypothetical protein [Rahnella sp. ChDrAdgB13]